MDGLALDIEGSHAGGGQHGDFLTCNTAKILQQRGLAGARTAGDEDAPVRLLHNIQRTLELVIYLDISHGYN